MSIGLSLGLHLGRGGAVGHDYGPLPEGEWLVIDQSGRYVVTGDSYVTADPVGVPLMTLSSSESTEAWWARHWANPDGINYVAPGDLPLHANTVTVLQGADLQAAIDAAPDNTTIRLEGGATAFDRIVLYNRSGIHVVADDPLDRPILRGVELYAHARAFYYLWQDGWVNAIIPTARDGSTGETGMDDAAIFAYRHPPRDVIFRDIDFVGDPLGTTDQFDFTRDPPYGAEAHHDRPTNNPTYMVGVKDVLYERCTFSGYNHSDNTGAWPGTVPVTIHAGMIYGSGGVEGVVVRDCTLDPTAVGVGGINWWPCAVYLDGAMNCVVHNNTLLDSWRQAIFLFLTNDDVLNDWNRDGENDRITEMRHAKFCAVVGNTVDNGNFFATLRGEKILIAENTWNANALRYCFALLETAVQSGTIGATSGPYPPSYPLLDTVIRDNVVENGGVGQPGYGFVTLKLAAQLAQGAVLGRVTVTNNGVDTSVPNGWFLDDTGGDDADPDGGSLAAPNVLTGNYIF